MWNWNQAIKVAVFVMSFACQGLVPASAADTPRAKPVLQEQAAHFWQTVSAPANQRPRLLEKHFSTAIRKRNGDASLLETFANLAEVVGDLSAAKAVQVAGGKEAELHYTLTDGRRVALLLTLTTTADPQIERFGVRPLPPEVKPVPASQLPEVIAARVRQEFQAERFSGAVVVARGNNVIYADAVGWADRAKQRANALDTPINLGSINKMFTAIAIAQLQAAGKLNWQDTVGKHLPNFPNATIRDQVTIHQLLTHTSGVGSYWNKAYEAAKESIDTQQEFLATFVDQPLSFKPGEGLEYSNGGPVILGLIIEAISGQDYYDYVREHIYQPAGMASSDHYRREDTQSGVALGYLKAEDGTWKTNHDSLGQRGSAAGGGYASARDMLAFSRALSAQRLLSKSQLDVLWQAYSQPGPIGYGYLFTVGNTAGHRWIGHDGGAPGIAAEFIHYPEEKLVIIVLANQDNAAMPMREWLHALVEASLFNKP